MRFQQPKDPNESILVTFDFTAAGAGAVSAPSVACTVRRFDSTADASPAAMISGGAWAEGAVVYQRLVGGVDGNDYNVRCTASTAGGGALVIGAVLKVRSKPV